MNLVEYYECDPRGWCPNPIYLCWIYDLTLFGQIVFSH